MRAVEWMLRRLFPPKCVLCGGLLSERETDLCGACWTGLPDFVNSHRKLRYIDEWTAVCYYEGKARESLLRFKFSGRRSYAAAYGRLLAARISRLGGEYDILCYVPVSKKRLRRRGYDQGALLAAAVGRELGIPVTSALRKIRDNPPQSGISDAARRRANVTGVYRAEYPKLQGKRVLLLDDILTTGATMCECARVLRTAGAVQITAAAFACSRMNQKM